MRLAHKIVSRYKFIFVAEKNLQIKKKKRAKEGNL